MLDKKLVAAQACDNKTIACKEDCKSWTSVTQVLRCIDACGSCKAEWNVADWDLFGTSKTVESQVLINESSAVATIRNINEEEMAYASEHPNLGFTPDIALVVGMLNEEDAELAATGSKNGYTFTYTAVEPVNHAIRSYIITAVPNQVGKTGQRRFYSDESGEIRYNSGGPADSNSPVLR